MAVDDAVIDNDAAVDDHPAGPITLPTRIRAEVKILAMTGVPATMFGLAVVTLSSSSEHSIGQWV